jgi:hypothetical protein
VIVGVGLGLGLGLAIDKQYKDMQDVFEQGIGILEYE